MESIGKEITELETKIEESDKTLDDLYSNLRRMTGANREKPKYQQRREFNEPKPVEISLEDIAIIKDKKKQDINEDGA